MGRRTGRPATDGTSRRRLLPTLAFLLLLPLVAGDSFLGYPRRLVTGGDNDRTAEVLGQTETRVAPRDFTLSGSIATPFVPGASRPLDVVIENPDPYPLEVTAISVSFGNPVRAADGRANPRCRVTGEAADLVVERGLIGSVTVPPNGTRSLSELSVPQERWPLLTMVNLPISQDACRNSTFPLVLTGSGRVA